MVGSWVGGRFAKRGKRADFRKFSVFNKVAQAIFDLEVNGNQCTFNFEATPLQSDPVGTLLLEAMHSAFGENLNHEVVIERGPENSISMTFSLVDAPEGPEVLRNKLLGPFNLLENSCFETLLAMNMKVQDNKKALPPECPVYARLRCEDTDEHDFYVQLFSELAACHGFAGEVEGGKTDYSDGVLDVLITARALSAIVAYEGIFHDPIDPGQSPG